MLLTHTASGRCGRGRTQCTVLPAALAATSASAMPRTLVAYCSAVHARAPAL